LFEYEESGNWEAMAYPENCRYRFPIDLKVNELAGHNHPDSYRNVSGKIEKWCLSGTFA